jgi:hypothetical protein
MTIIGIDNGVTGSIGIIQCDNDGITNNGFYLTPIKKVRNYQKAKKFCNRIDFEKLNNIIGFTPVGKSLMAYIERPMINSSRFVASISAARSLEATLCCLEDLNIPYCFVDSKEWQKKLFHSQVDTKDEKDLKHLSVELTKKVFPSIYNQFPKQKDFDGLMIAYWAYLYGGK